MLCSACRRNYIAKIILKEEYPREYYCEICGSFVIEYKKRSEDEKRKFA